MNSKSKTSAASTTSKVTVPNSQIQPPVSDRDMNSAQPSLQLATQFDVEDFILSLKMKTMQQMIQE